MKFIILLSSLMFLLLACKKEEGEGGQANIRGKVFARFYNKTFSTLIGESYIPETDVYIIYGDSYSYGDRVRTNYDGAFEFKYLRQGNYTVYVYSKDSTGLIPSGVIPVKTEVKISKKNQTIVLNDLIIIEN